MTGSLDAHRAKIHRQHVKRGLCAALYRGGCQSRKAVHTLALHGLNQHRARGAARERFDQCRGQCIHKTGVYACQMHYPTNSIQHIVQRA